MALCPALPRLIAAVRPTTTTGDALVPSRMHPGDRTPMRELLEHANGARPELIVLPRKALMWPKLPTG